MKVFLAATAAMLTTGAAGAAGAADAVPAPALEEVVVTAQKRAENLQDVPAAVQAYGPEAIKASRIETLLDLPKYAPSYKVFSLGSGAPRAFMRGVGTNDLSIGSDQDVAVFLDDVYVGRTGTAVNAFADVERVEVLKGPQGALFGRSAIGGAISVITRPPTDEFSLELEGALGSDDQDRLRATMNLPIIEGVLAARFNASVSHMGGYVENLSNGEMLGRQNNTLYRAALRWTPSDRLTADLKLDYSRGDGDVTPQRSNSISPAVTATYGVQRENAPFHKTFSDLPRSYGGEYRQSWGALLRFEYESDLGTLTTITSYRGYDLSYDGDGEWTSRPILILAQASGNKTYGQEVRFTSDAARRFDWMIGASYFRENVSQRTRRNIGYPILSILRGGQPFPQSLMVVERTFGRGEYDNASIFADVGYDLTERLRVQASLRYSYDSKKFFIQAPGIAELNNAGIFFSVVPNGLRRQKTWHDLSPRITASYDVTDNVMAYATLGRGYKPGGFNVTSIGGDAINPFAEENVTSVEVGVKSELFDRRLRFNADVYSYKFDGLQVTALENGVLVTRNGKTDGQGFEADVAWQVNENLNLSGAFAYTDAKYERFTARRSGVLVSFAGNRVIYTPEFAWSAIADYRQPLGKLGELQLRAENIFTGKQYFDPDNIPYNTEPSYHMTNVRVALTAPNDRWTVAAVGQNIFKTKYRLRTNIGLEGFGFPVLLDGPPAYYGVELTLRY